MSENERYLPDWLEAFMSLTQHSEPPLLFRKWTGIATIASALQRKCRTELGLSLTVFPNFYIVLVGPSATGKGTSMKYAYDIIENVPAIRLSAQATSLQALIRRMKDTNLTDIDIETGRQLFHSSMTIFSNEFTVFLGYHNRDLIAALCDWYDCHPRWTYDTIKRDREEVIGVWVNILAGTTPENIQSALPMEAIGTGLTSRIIFVNEEKKDKLVIFHDPTESEFQLQQDLVHDLEQITLMSGTFRFTEGAIEFYSNWCRYADENPPFHDPKFDGYCGRRRNHLISLAMVCSASRNNDLVLLEDDFKRAAALLFEVEIRMGTVFRGMGRSDISALIHEATAFVERSTTDEIPLWQFARHFEGDMDKLVMDRILYTLEASGHIKRLRRPGIGEFILKQDRSKIEQSTEPEDDSPLPESS